MGARGVVYECVIHCEKKGCSVSLKKPICQINLCQMGFFSEIGQGFRYVERPNFSQ